MNIPMNDAALNSPEAIKRLLEGIGNVELQIAKSDRYDWVARTLKRTGYLRLRKRDKSTVREYLLKMTGYSRQQLTRLIEQYKKRHRIGRKSSCRNSFPKKYTREDIFLLAKTDEAHGTFLVVSPLFDKEWRWTSR